MSPRQIFNEEGHRDKLLTMTVEEMLSMRDIMSQCWRAFLQLAPAGANMVTEDEVLDLTATQAMELDPPPSNLRSTPHGGDLSNLTEAEKRWISEERQ
eukprot:260515-Alexandrium_andersonii.AAC.1